MIRKQRVEIMRVRSVLELIIIETKGRWLLTNAIHGRGTVTQTNDGPPKLKLLRWTEWLW
jgi:hypothetical protein